MHTLVVQDPISNGELDTLMVLRNEVKYPIFWTKVKKKSSMKIYGFHMTFYFSSSISRIGKFKHFT